MADWTNYTAPPTRPAGGPRPQGDRTPIPFGVYRCRLADLRLTASGARVPTAKLIFKIVDGPHAGRPIYKDVWLTEAARAHSDREAVALGYPNADALTTAAPPLGRLFDVVVALAPSRAGGWHNVVERFEAVAADPAAEPRPEATYDASPGSKYDYCYSATDPDRPGPTADDDAAEIARARLVAAELLGAPAPADATTEAPPEADDAPEPDPEPEPEPRPWMRDHPGATAAHERILAHRREWAARKAANGDRAPAPAAPVDDPDSWMYEDAPAPGAVGGAA